MYNNLNQTTMSYFFFKDYSGVVLKSLSREFSNSAALQVGVTVCAGYHRSVNVYRDDVCLGYVSYPDLEIFRY